MFKAMRCEKCTKIVGWAEAVVRDEKKFHRECFSCAGCSKKLDRGQGLKLDNDYYCNICHKKHFGPGGFRKGVIKTSVQTKRVQMNMQPAFAHTVVKATNEPWWKGQGVGSKNEKTENKTEPEALHEFDVALYEGKTVSDLEQYLTEGNVDFSKWGAKTVKELQEQIDCGKCELGMDVEGNCLRVANIAKVFLFDADKLLLLFNPVNSHEESEFVENTKTKISSDLSLLQKVVGTSTSKGLGKKNTVNMYKGVSDMMMMTRTKQKSKNVEVPSSTVFETTFSPFKETARDAAARVLSWRLGLSMVTGRIFSKVVPTKQRDYKSTHFPGLKCEYHVHHVRLNSEFVVPLQKVLPVDEISPMVLDEDTNTGINTHWYCWLSVKSDAKQLAKGLDKNYNQNQKVKTMLGEADFTSDMALAIAEFMKDEAELLDLFGK